MSSKDGVKWETDRWNGEENLIPILNTYYVQT